MGAAYVLSKIPGVESVVQAVAAASGVSAKIPACLIYEAVGGEEVLLKVFPSDSRSPAAQMSCSFPGPFSP